MFDAAYPPPVIGGKEKQAHLLSKGLLSIGVKVNVISFRHNNNRSSSFEGVKVTRLRRGLLLPFSMIFHLLRSRLSANILHIHTPSRVGRIVAVLGKIFGFSIVFKFPGQALAEYVGLLDKASWNLVFKCSSALVVLESNTYERLVSKKLACSKVRTMANGVVLGTPSQANKNIVPKLLFVGRLVELKRCVDLLHACSILKRKRVDFILSVVGDGPEKTTLEQLVEVLQLQNNVIFEGYREDPVSLMSESDILILPSRTEGMSNVILEAMSIGLPVIATDVGAARGLLGEFGSQFLVPPFRPDLLSVVLEKLILDEKLRDDYSRNLYLHCKEKFSITSVAQQYKSMYNSL
ncbi:glycosyltransferase family 4 protein [Marinobacter salarius]|uniref:glycosyltransferase family 4 protein n=1 Tax=Marinobacter salarius TaxID=1420917 RepID=UPI001D183901|nr:glycosyltransferase family 4 protein [Marinobacter salarius]MCC4282807.1 glycosyltransferase family 4 protein [Marinobacter salarius]